MIWGVMLIQRGGKMKASWLIIFFSVILWGCKKETPDMGMVKIKLTNAPARFTSINLDIKQVKIHTDNSHPKADWIELSTNAGVYDVLTLTNGAEALIAEGEVPEGPYQELKLELGTNNTVVIDGATYPLEVPPASDPLMKFGIAEHVEEGQELVLLLDFDPERSIVHEADRYVLKPRLRAIAEEKSGSIKGKVEPASASAVVYAIGPGDSIACYPGSSGEFMIRALIPGSYRLSVVPQPPYATTVVPWVGVKANEESDVGSIILTQ